MAKRGRKSTAELAMVKNGKFASIMDSRPPAPDTLDEEEANLWNVVVQSMYQEAFPKETHALLEIYIRHVFDERFISNAIRRWKAEGIETPQGTDQFNTLLRMRQREAHAVMTIGRSLRITPHSRVDPKTAGRAASNRTGHGLSLPWED